jgi:hypothetical protein
VTWLSDQMGFGRTIKKKVIGRHVARLGEKNNTCLVCSVRNTKGLKRKCGLRRENDIEMNMKESVWESLR